MFEFHGWLRVQVDDHDDVDPSELRKRESSAETLLRQIIADHTDAFSLIELRRCSNGMKILIAHGLRNHRFQAAIALFESAAKALPHSYGLLFYHDDEHATEANVFRIIRFVRGANTIHEDCLLSPVVPTIEDGEG